MSDSESKKNGDTSEKEDTQNHEDSRQESNEVNQKNEDGRQESNMGPLRPPKEMLCLG